MNLPERIRKLEEAIRRLAARTSIVYAKGSYTPTYAGSTAAGTTTYSTQQGRYVRIGSLVICWAQIVWTNATGTGNVRLGGLPFTSASGVIYAFAGQFVNVTFANGSVEGILSSGSTTAQLNSPATNAAGTELAIETAGTIRYTIVYRTE